MFQSWCVHIYIYIYLWYIYIYIWDNGKYNGNYYSIFRFFPHLKLESKTLVQVPQAVLLECGHAGLDSCFRTQRFRARDVGFMTSGLGFRVWSLAGSNMGVSQSYESSS